MMQSRTYKITFVGQAGTTLRAAFDDCEVSVGPGTTTLRAELPDQGALQGLLQRITGLRLEKAWVAALDDWDGVFATLRETGLLIAHVPRSGLRRLVDPVRARLRRATLATMSDRLNGELLLDRAAIELSDDGGNGCDGAGGGLRIICGARCPGGVRGL
jgi:hypothetical protein